MTQTTGVLRLRGRVTRTFGITAGRRAALLRSLLEQHPRAAATYWLQLSLATGMALFGLVLDNTGVVIGAMLVSPLMEPIVALAMGLTVGSAAIALRSFLRALWSLVAVILGSALITAALPFHEVTREIAARTAPTALDLLVAAFCALAAAVTTVRVTSDGATAAAGTAIAIALVPPLCVVGFGIGTGNPALASGASLLFVANLCAILMVAVLAFLVFGFTPGNLPVAPGSSDDRHLSSRAGRWLQSLFGSRFSPALRFLMPAALLAMVYLPLSRALSEVTWQVRSRAAFERILKEAGVADSLVRTSVVVERRSFQARLLMVGDAGLARTLERKLIERLIAAIGGQPRVEVRAVPDLEAVHATTVAARVAAAAATTPEPDWPQAERAITDGLAGAWPGASAGPLLGWRVGPGEGGTSLLEVWHLGNPLGTAGEGLLGRLLARQLGAELRIRAHAVAPRLEGAASPSPSFLLPALEVIDQVSRVAAAHVCLTTPSVVKGNEDRRRRRRPRPAAQVTELQAAFLAALDRIPAHRRHQLPGRVWQLDVQQGPCIAPGAAGDRLTPQRRP